MSMDIERHSSPDNYSCEPYERNIRTFKQQKHNSKGLEATYAERESIRRFINHYELKNGPLQKYDTDSVHFKFDLGSVINLNSCYLNESGLTAEKELVSHLHKQGTIPQHIQDAVADGILLGKLKLRPLEISQYRDIIRFVHQHHDRHIKVPRRAFVTKKIAKFYSNNELQLFTEGDMCVVSGWQNNEEWYVKLKLFILVGPVGGMYYIFLDGDFYIPVWRNNRVDLHPWTKTPKLVKRVYTANRLQPSSSIQRKLILYPEPGAEKPSYFLPVDFDKERSQVPVCVPHYPKAGDYIAVRGRAQSTWYARVKSVDLDSRVADVAWLDEVRLGVLRVRRDGARIPFISILRGISVRRTNQGFVIAP